MYNAITAIPPVVSLPIALGSTFIAIQGSLNLFEIITSGTCRWCDPTTQFTPQQKLVGVFIVASAIAITTLFLKALNHRHDKLKHA